MWGGPSGAMSSKCFVEAMIEADKAIANATGRTLNTVDVKTITDKQTNLLGKVLA